MKGDEAWEMFQSSLPGPDGSSHIDVKQGMKEWGFTETAAQVMTQQAMGIGGHPDAWVATR
eukprot:5000883-Alexandrium_andersonii.AAC.1